MNEISELKLQIRLNKVVRNLQDSVAKTLPTVLTNIKKVDELHQLRKDYKKLRYSFELVSRRSKNISRQIDYLKEIQDILGAIHDDDIVIEYLQNVRHSDGVSNILNDQIADRNMQYEEFVRFIEETTHAASKETMFLKN
jgi:CHAD domain-containing protein